MTRSLSREELLKIGAALETYHAVFYVFWDLVDARFTDEVPRAAVRFGRDGGRPSLLLNEVWWTELTHLEKLFVVCHECLHVFLDHGVRNGRDVPGATPDLVNRAQDVTINEMIVDLFRFNREDLRGWQRYCWIDTCFRYPQLVARRETFTYYLKKLIEEAPHRPPTEPELLDDHEERDGDERVHEKLTETLAEKLGEEDLERVARATGDEDGVVAGALRGTIERMLGRESPTKRLNVKLLVRRLKRTRLSYVTAEGESFGRFARRYDDVIVRHDVTLPGTGDRDVAVRDRLRTLLFMDVSGSCMEHFDLFQRLFHAFDAERDVFDARAFFFDVAVSEVKVGEKVRVGGGTNFEIIEEQVLRVERETGRYADCVVVLTDGYGTAVTPKLPRRWVWLLTPYAETKHVPAGSRSFQVDQVVF